MNNLEVHFQIFSDCVMDHAFHTLDASGTIVSWNRGAERLFGFSTTEAIGLPVSLLYTSEAQAREEAHHDLRIAAGRGQHEVEGWRVRKDGGIIDAYVVITALRDDQNRLTGYAVVTRDITRHQRALHELLDQQRRMRSILDTAVDAIVIIDERGIIESFNPAGEQMFGYTAAEIIGQNVNRLMPEPFSSEHTSYIQRYLRTGDARIIGVGREVQARRRDGSLFPADLAVSIFYDGKPLFTGILRDITDRKRMEAEVLEIADAEQRRIGQELHDDAQQQLAGLTMIARHATDSLSPFVAGEPQLAEIQKRLERVVQGLRDANQSLRTLARGLVPMQVDAHGLLDALDKLAGQISEGHGIACRFTADRNVDVRDNVVATNLYRITQEAINNALKHSAASEIVIRLSSDGRATSLEIRDNGHGIPQGQTSLGRGLQIMAYRAGLVGGILTVKSGEAGGTIVTCNLPQFMTEKH